MEPLEDRNLLSEVLSAVPNLTMITDANVGTGKLVIAIALNPTSGWPPYLAPVVSFIAQSPGLVDRQSVDNTLGHNGGTVSFTGPWTCTASFNVADADVYVPAVGFTVTQPNKVYPPWGVPWFPNAFGINTLNTLAAVTNVTPSVTTVTSNNVGVLDPPL